MKDLCFAAIDIGSNAVRLSVKSIRTDAAGKPRPEQQLLIRFPLRLGKEAFTKGKISEPAVKQLLHLMKSFQQMLKVFPLTAFRACATAAMRDARNGEQIALRIRKKTGIPVEIISGEEEARLVYAAHIDRSLREGNGFMYMDVGGGSTQVSLIRDGEVIFSHSFDIGTVRMMTFRVEDKEKTAFLTALKSLREQYPDFKLVGSGGNINKLYRLLKENNCILNVEKLRLLNKELTGMLVDERMTKYKIKRDRAEVIGYAADIFVHAAEAMRIDDILVPSISLCDGIIDNACAQYYVLSDAHSSIAEFSRACVSE
ncbi:MAG: Ppx/GppA family phosphatase [Tannerellaceae bacterium]|jgi:exopolyphosphatase/guanosine-5'-triphosphate,3'-diphosphate pyrophosphatase|nr:Ppx/GppA family phosphatase [Tannerellaceae bacterium]